MGNKSNTISISRDDYDLMVNLIDESSVKFPQIINKNTILMLEKKQLQDETKMLKEKIIQLEKEVEYQKQVISMYKNEN
jgi:hypothetical protein